jgi:hypothetical protein
MCRTSRRSGALTYRIPMGLLRHVTGQLLYSVCVIITVTFVLCKLPNVSTDSAQFPSRLQTFVQYVARNMGPRYSKLLNAHTGCALLGHDVASLSNKLQNFQEIYCFRNVGNPLPYEAASYPTRREPSCNHTAVITAIIAYIKQ